MKLIVKPWFHSFSTILNPKYEEYIKFICAKFIPKPALSSEYKNLKTISNSPSIGMITLSNYNIEFACITHWRTRVSCNDHIPLVSQNPLTISKGAFFIRPYSTNSHKNIKEAASAKSNQVDKNNDEDESKLGLVQKFKLMYKRYWYVLIPVHVFTSVIWYGSFFFAAKSGVDLVPLMENIGLSEKFLHYLRNSDAGYYGIAYAMYKLATPARYTVTLGGTTLSINYLKNRGYIKPVPTRNELKVMYQDKREEIKDITDEMREKYHDKREELLERAGEIHDRYLDKKEEIREKYHDKRKEFMRRQRIQRNSKDRTKLNGKKR